MSKYPAGFVKLNDYINSILDTQPDPPRAVSFGALFGKVYAALGELNPLKAFFKTSRMKSALAGGVKGTCTIAAITHTVAGSAEVTREVKSGSRTFTEKAELNQSWQRDVKEGDQLHVLVHPSEEKVVLELGKGKFVL